MYCGKCGSEILKGYSFCMNCGTKVEIESSVDTSKGVSHKKKKSKIIIPIISVVVIITIGGVGFYYLNYIEPFTGYYGKTKWGMTSDKIEKLIDDENLIKSGELLIVKKNNYNGNEGLSAEVSYSFSNDKLETVVVVLTVGENTQYTNKNVIKIFQDKYNNLYGKAEEHIFSTKWITNSSEIKLLNASDKVVTVTYKAIHDEE